MSQKQQITFLAAFAFCLYGIHRLRFVGHCDEWAYFAQAQLLRGRDPGLHSFPNPLRHPALTPLGMDVVQGRYVSAFPPGYSVLLALFGFLGAEYWVNPLLGAVCTVLVYLALVREVSHSWALAGAASWAVCPLVAMNATDVMSDMAATVAVLSSYLSLRAKREGAAGAVLGLSLMVRPMNALVLPASAFLVSRRPRRVAAFGVSLVAGGAVSAAVTRLVWGTLLSPTYQDNLERFRLACLPAQLPGYLWQTFLHLGPILVLSLIECVRSPRRSAPELLWLGAFFVVYPVWGPIQIDWLRARFLLPAYPAAFVLAARAIRDLGPLLRQKIRRLPLTSLTIALSAFWGAFSLARSFQIGALRVHAPRDVDCDQIASHVPRNALVGALEFSGSLRVYAGLETFGWNYPGAVAFARSEYLKGRPIYLLIEPAEALNGEYLGLARQFPASFQLAPQFSLREPGYVLQKVVGLRTPGYIHLALADPSSQWALGEGWLGPEELSATDYKGAFCKIATLELPLQVGVSHELSLVAAAPEVSPSVSLEFLIRGDAIGRVEIGPEFRPVTFHIDRAIATGIVPLEIRIPGAPECNASRRKVVARVQSVDTRVLSN